MPIQIQPYDDRLTTFPIRRHDVWKFYKKHEALHWTIEEIKLGKDREHFSKLSPEEQHFLKYVLGFFASSDKLVNINLIDRFKKDIPILEVEYFLDLQIRMENLHSEGYSLLIDVCITDEDEKDRLFNSIKTIPAITKKAQWFKEWTESDDSLEKRLIASACMEGIFFSGSFCSIFWLGSKGLLPGVAAMNEFINRDEGLHTRFSCHLYKMCDSKLSFNEVVSIVDKAVQIEKDFINQALPYRLHRMNAQLMSQHIESVADNLLILLGYDNVYYNSKSPFPFMDLINQKCKANFFEVDATEYSMISTDFNEPDHGNAKRQKISVLDISQMEKDEDW